MQDPSNDTNCNAGSEAGRHKYFARVAVQWLRVVVKAE